jgi:hypothetical protein
MSTQVLKGKRIAVLGGLGARPEAAAKLREELEVAELVWIYSERSQVKPFINFLDGVHPDKYDYIFVLTKFISHKLWDVLKKTKTALGETPIIKVPGSYNTENFIRSLFKQSFKPEEVEQVEQVLPKPVFRTFLKPEELSDPGPLPVVAPKEDVQGEARWQEMFGASTPEEAKARVDKRILALEARVAKLSANQLDEGLIKAASAYHSAVVGFFNDLPVPNDVNRAEEGLIKSLQKHNVAVTKPIGGENPANADVQAAIMRTNIILSTLMDRSINLLSGIANNPLRDRFGACVSCKRHKSAGCGPDCGFSRLNGLVKTLTTSVNLVKPPSKNLPPFMGHM